MKTPKLIHCSPGLWLALGVTALVILATGVAHAADALDTDGDGLPDSWERGFGRYEIVTGSFSWDQAKQDAVNRGGHLATVINATEWADIKAVLGANLYGKNLWIGGTDELSEGRWKWITGEKWTFDNWRAGEPSNDSLGTGHGAPENYLMIWGKETAAIDGNNLFWNDVPITGGVLARDGYILERGSWTDPNDPDTDHDGLADSIEAPLKAPFTSATDPNNPDTDGDGLSDGEEVNLYLTNPASDDTDQDGLSDFDELRRLGTNPLSADSDGDGLADGAEIFVYHTNPNLKDTDGDGFSDSEEVAAGTNPLDKNSSIAIKHRTYTAARIEFDTKIGESYQLQSLLSGGTWQNLGGKIAGDGQVHQLLLSTRQSSMRLWRVVLAK